MTCQLGVPDGSKRQFYMKRAVRPAATGEIRSGGRYTCTRHSAGFEVPCRPPLEQGHGEVPAPSIEKVVAFC